jgi:hypothetical protein
MFCFVGLVCGTSTTPTTNSPHPLFQKTIFSFLCLVFAPWIGIPLKPFARHAVLYNETMKRIRTAGGFVSNFLFQKKQFAIPTELMQQQSALPIERSRFPKTKQKHVQNVPS